MAKLVAEMGRFDAQHGWDLLYSRFGPVGTPGPEENAIVAALHDLAGDGPALELAVGNGRIAIPLAETGVEVDGIQQDMWRSKQGISLIPMVHRHASLAELDLMARNAGLRRREVWGGWTRDAYGPDSVMCLATYTAA